MPFNSNIFNPAWVTGFIDGEATFYVGISAKDDMVQKQQVQLEFAISQHIRDAELMNKFVLFFGCGYVAKPNKNILQYRIRNVQDLGEHLFPLLDAYPLQSQKRLDAQAFREVHSLVLSKQHLTVKGLDQIQLIKSTMNRARMGQYKTS